MRQWFSTSYPEFRMGMGMGRKPNIDLTGFINHSECQSSWCTCDYIHVIEPIDLEIAKHFPLLLCVFAHQILLRAAAGVHFCALPVSCMCTELFGPKLKMFCDLGSCTRGLVYQLVYQRSSLPSTCLPTRLYSLAETCFTKPLLGQGFVFPGIYFSKDIFDQRSTLPGTYLVYQRPSLRFMLLAIW